MGKHGAHHGIKQLKSQVTMQMKSICYQILSCFPRDILYKGHISIGSAWVYYRCLSSCLSLRTKACKFVKVSGESLSSAFGVSNDDGHATTSNK